MTLLLTRDTLAERRLAARGPLAPLAESLRQELQPLLDRGFHVPVQKALLSRDGGRCARDGSTLFFDPWAAHEHRCATCGSVYTGERHDRWWITFYHLWLAERAVHAAVLHALHGGSELAGLTRAIVERYSHLYLEYPNRDNVLGPSRPFFSTYLESIWILQLAVALDVLEDADAVPRALAEEARERLFAPSAALVASFDEGGSNRQVWNNAAVMAAGALLGDRSHIKGAIEGESGLLAHLTGGLLPDGTWFEGENYHLFAHRGLWYGVTLARRIGVELPEQLASRFAEGFATPFLTALPDFTFPSRRDSPYAVSLRQWRTAESAELGLVEREDPRLRGALFELYRSDVPRGDTGRARSTAEVERNEPASALTRADLGWRSLLFARAELPPLRAEAPRSVLLDGQGYAVLRRDEGSVYVALDYGESGGGHGHPDRLDLLLSVGAARWLDDPGTGSYVDPSLHWYRSTLAHNAPLVDGRSQPRASGSLRAFDERGGVGWADAVLTLPESPRVTIGRSVVAMPDYIVDWVRVESGAGVRLELPIHTPMSVEGARWSPRPIDGGEAPEDGFGFLRETARWQADEMVRVAVRTQPPGDGWFLASGSCTWWTAVAPGPPGRGDQHMHVLRISGQRPWIETVWSWRGAVSSVELEDGALLVRHADGSSHLHRRDDRGWHIELRSGAARSSIDLGGARQPLPETSRPPGAAPSLVDLPAHFTLGRDSYRMSEQSWDEAGQPRALVDLSADGEHLTIDVTVDKLPRCFRAADSADPRLDNETPDIHSDGLQLHLWGAGWPAEAAWLAIPVPGAPTMRLRPVAGARRDIPLEAAWHETPSGWAARLRIPRQALPIPHPGAIALDLLVNEIEPGRERRRGQLVLSGGGETVYLRGDRQDRARFLWFALP
ncbi:MAG TPA: heparinase II/III family protein [Gemmatimonadaceae bacterium]|nr:heparinase II/III family protein [Gemmatimonadaceae bacterium]